MHSKKLNITLLLGIVTILLNCITPALGQLSPSLYDYPQNHLPWYTIETDHFEIHFQKGNSRSARVSAHIAEEIYPEITSLYQHEPDTKVDIILKDRQDYSNGAAYFFDNQIEIWVSSLNTPLRGTHDWLWDVITHEFTHIVQLQVAMKKGRQLPAIYLQWLSYSDVRRPDVLYGYPKGILTYPFASINVPAWFAEGVAQYQRQTLYHDYWDPHRDMILRCSLLAGDPVPLDGMAFFTSKHALDRERIYNQGFAFTNYLANNHGEDIIPRISELLAQNGTFTINEALQHATDTSAQKLFNSFVSESRNNYQEATAALQFTPTNTVQDSGFFNFYPTLSPDHKTIAYLSNKNFKSSATQLFIESVSDSTTKQTAINDLMPLSSHPIGSTHPQAPLIKRIQSSFAFSPDSKTLTFSRQTLNKYGEQYNDLFLYDLSEESEQRLTHSKRLFSPDWHPTKQQLVAVQQTSGSSNLALINLPTNEISPLTNFSHGEQVYTPVWHPDGEQIYFGTSDTYSRNIHAYDLETGSITPVLKDTLTDYRDPFVDPDGKYLYYSAAPDGIFNIFRITLEQPNAPPQKLTSVPGGAFMPFVVSEKLYFAEYKADGYQISSINITEHTLSQNSSYQYSEIPFKRPDSPPDRPDLNNISGISPKKLQQLALTDSLSLNNSNTNTGTLRTYSNNYTSFSLYPVIRFDNYSKKHGSNSSLLTAGHIGDFGRNLLRDIKLGVYFSSRDVTDKLSIFGGALIGFASEPADGIGNFFSPARLTDLDRDLFTIIEYEGLPFIKKRWSPTVSVELYNMRRNVADGLQIEEFPCTSCLPDTTSADIAYNIWEADIFLRSKINAHSMVELGAGYTPYRVQTDGFFSKELEQFVPSSSSEYYRGTTFTSAYIYENYLPYPHSDVAPLGLRTTLRYSYEPSKLLEKYEVEDNTLSPVYKSVKNHSLQTTVRYGLPLSPHSAISLYGRGFSYLNAPGDSFYLDYIGGFTGMRSYPYFAIGGHSTAMGQLAYSFPLVKNISHQLGRHSLDKLYLRLFGEAGNGWRGPLEIGNDIKTGFGAELRFAFNSYYLFPLKLFISSAYGFNSFDITLPDEFITQSSENTVSYGNEFIFHFGLTFDFDVLNHD